jgi:hypothetical protein
MKKLIIIILITLAISACDTDNNTPDPVINPGDTTDNPITRIENRQLTSAAWATLLNEIKTDGKYVALDLSACTRGDQTSGGGLWNDGSFNPDPALPNVEEGRNKIVSLILPEAATSTAEGKFLHYDSTGKPVYEETGFDGFTNLKNITGVNITTISRTSFIRLGTYYTSEGVAAWKAGILTSIDFPNVTTIGERAFEACYNLINVNIPKVKTIEREAFFHTKLQNIYIPEVNHIGTQALLSSFSQITLGKTAPLVDGLLFSVGENPRTVTVRVPQGATGYGDIPKTFIGGDIIKNWGNAFRGMGWNPSKANQLLAEGYYYDSEGYGPVSLINSNITLVIEYIP